MPTRTQVTGETLRCRIVHQGSDYFVKLPVRVHRRITEPELVAIHGPALTVEYRSHQGFDCLIADLAARKDTNANKLARFILATLSVVERPADGLLELPARIVKLWQGDVPDACVVFRKSPDIIVVCREDRLAELATGPKGFALALKARLSEKKKSAKVAAPKAPPTSGRKRPRT